MTALNTPIVFNNSTGNDATASGSPSTRAFITTLSLQITSGSATTYGTANGAINVGDLVYVPSQTSGRKFNVIASINTSVSPTVYTFDEVWDASDFSATCYSGGKRANFDNADSRRLFTSDVVAGSTIESETDQNISSNMIIGPATATQPLTVDCKNNAIVRTFTTAWTYTLRLREYTIFKNATHTTATNFVYGIEAFQQGAADRFQWIENVHVSNFWTNFACLSRGNYNFSNCSFRDATDRGLYADGPDNLSIFGCISDGNAKGVEIDNGTVNLYNCIISNNTANGCDFNSANVTAISNVFLGNTSSGMIVTGFSFPDAKSLGIRNNIFDSNGSYGINVTATGGLFRCYRNAFRNNTSGETSGITSVDTITLTADPFVDAAAGDFNVNADAGGGDTLRANNYELNTDTSVYPFRQYVSDPFGGGGSTFHPLAQ